MSEIFTIPKLEPGHYQHYKGNMYNVLGVGRHSERYEYLVAYSPVELQDGKPAIWLRPYEMFIETVEINGETPPGFQRIEE